MSDFYATDRPAADLGRAIRKGKGTSGTTYFLHRAPWQTHRGGLSLWTRYTEDGEKRATLTQDDLPETAREDFDYYVDRVDEETRTLVAAARAEFGY